MSLGELLRKLRKERDLTLDQVGKSLGGLSRSAVANWELSNNKPSTSHILKLADLYSVEPRMLLEALTSSIVAASAEAES